MESNIGASVLTGTWSGWVENHQFNDGSDAVVMTFTDGDPLEGHITFGDWSAPPPAMDPDDGYPPDPYYIPEGTSSIVPGFVYSARNASLTGRRLQFDIVYDELWARWCELQTPVADDDDAGVYRCIRNWGSYVSEDLCTQTNPETQEMVTVNCRRLDLCLYSPVCSCTADGCMSADARGEHFDLVIDVPHADGSYAGGLRVIHLTKD